MARRRAEEEEAMRAADPPAHLLNDTESESERETTATEKKKATTMESELFSTLSSSPGACATGSLGSWAATRHVAVALDETSMRKRRDDDDAASNQHGDDESEADHDDGAQRVASIHVDTKQVATAGDDGDHRMDEPESTEIDTIMTSPEVGDDDNDDIDDADSVDDCCSLVSMLSADRCSTTSSMDVECAESAAFAAIGARRKWIHAIQNESYQPKPTAFSPLGSFEEDPLLGQRRQCRDKLDALEHVRSRVQFLPFVPTIATTRENASSSKMEPSMKIQTRMILSKLDDDGSRSTLDYDEHDDYESIGIEALSGLESLFFTYLTHKELIRVSEVCRSWKSMARHNLIWEPILFTPFERYPLRELLGVGKDLPAMQVFMIFKRLRLSELPREADMRSSAEARRLHHQPPHRGRIADERERLRTWVRAQEDRTDNGNVERTRSVIRQTLGRSRSGSAAAGQMAPMESIHLVRFRGENPMAEAQDWPAAVTLQDQVPVLFANNRARTDRDDDEIHFVKDGYRRTSLRVWLLQQQRKVSEHTLRSFLRQMLLAIHALEQAGVLHADISTTSILVLERANKSAAGSTDASTQRSQQQSNNINTDETPVFQLHCSANTWYVGTQEAPTPRQQQQPAAHRHLERHERRLEDELLRIRRREAEQLDMFAALDEMDDIADIADLGGAAGGDGGGLEGFAQLAFQHRLHPPCMLNSLLRCAISLWSRGRFPDTNQNTNTPLLNLLVTLHAHIPAGFRSFVEFAKFLMLSGTPTAARLLNHAFVSDPLNKATIPIRAIQTQDVLDYQASVLAWYGNAQAVAARAASKRAAKEVAATIELMPRTQMGTAYFQHTLEEANLPQERFVSIVAPVVKSSSWIRRLAMTQSHTLQRLDLSNVMLPTSVLLKELSNLPRITHLRLPGNIERPDDLEHFLAALSCTDLLPNLRAMDENVKLAMDRIEKTYLDQLGMVEFLLGR